MIGKKKIDFDLLKYQICFVGYRKRWFLGIENLDLCLSHEIKSFDLKNIRFVFLRTKKWFLITEKLDLFFYMF